MKRLAQFTWLVFFAVFLLSACAEKGSKTLSGKGNGFNGSMEVAVKMENGKIQDIELVSHNDTGFVINRAFPVVKERILREQTPIVDSASGATYSSWGIKTAVAEALKSTGKKYDAITPATKGSEKKAVTIPDVTTQILVVGSGPAGLAAAITAAQDGMKVILIEKLDVLSGNGKYDRNFYDMVNTEAQKKVGFVDSADKFYADLKARGSGKDSDARMRAFADGSATTDAWLRSMGIELNFLLDGERSHMKGETEYAGPYIQDNFEKTARELGIDIRTGTKGLDLIMDGKKALGVAVQHENESYTILADSVIIATGGFSANTDLVAKYRPDMAGFPTTNQIGATGDFVSIFEKHGMSLVNMDVLNLFPFILIRNRELTGSSEKGTDFMLVNTEGKRFVNEFAERDVMAKTVISQKNSMAYYIFDEQAKVAGARIRTHIEKGLGITAATLEELASQLSVDATALKNTFESYNNAERGEQKDAFSRTKFTREMAASGPYYALAVSPAYHMTRGGVSADENARVLYPDGSAAEGLYAAGEVTSIIDGGYVASVVFGRIAGTQASAYVKNNK